MNIEKIVDEFLNDEVLHRFKDNGAFPVTNKQILDKFEYTNKQALLCFCSWLKDKDILKEISKQEER
jgi:NADH dehydrogenase/NADH:ubiquinone oxidoreductase subunit G